MALHGLVSAVRTVSVRLALAAVEFGARGIAPRVGKHIVATRHLQARCWRGIGLESKQRKDRKGEKKERGKGKRDTGREIHREGRGRGEQRQRQRQEKETEEKKKIQKRNRDRTERGERRREDVRIGAVKDTTSTFGSQPVTLTVLLRNANTGMRFWLVSAGDGWWFVARLQRHLPVPRPMANTCTITHGT